MNTAQFSAPGADPDHLAASRWPRGTGQVWLPRLPAGASDSPGHAALRGAIGWWDADALTPSSSWLANAGTGGPALDLLADDPNPGRADQGATQTWMRALPTAVRGVWLNGAGSGAAQVPHQASFDFSADFDIRVRASLDRALSGADATPLAAKGIAAASFGFRLTLNATTLALTWTNTSGAATTVTSSAFEPEFTSPTWYRVVKDADSGAGQNAITISTSTDGAAWTTVSTHTGATQPGMTTNTSAIEFGAFNGRNASTAMTLHQALLHTDLAASVLVLGIDLTAASTTSFTWPCTTGQTLAQSTLTNYGPRVVTRKTMTSRSTSPFPLVLTPRHRGAAAPMVDMRGHDDFTLMALVQVTTLANSPLTKAELPTPTTAQPGYAIALNASRQVTMTVANARQGAQTLTATWALTSGTDAIAFASRVRGQLRITTFGGGTASRTLSALEANGALRCRRDLTATGTIHVGGTGANGHFYATALWRAALTSQQMRDIAAHYGLPTA